MRIKQKQFRAAYDNRPSSSTYWICLDFRALALGNCLLTNHERADFARILLKKGLLSGQRLCGLRRHSIHE